jgi:hypothetical protein
MKAFPVMMAVEIMVTTNKKTRAYTGSVRSDKEGARSPASRMYIIPTTMQVAVVTVRLVLMTRAMFSVDRKRIMEESNPILEKRITRSSDEIRAVARPTCSIVYSRAAIIQKKKPQPALKILIEVMNKEFLYKGSLASLAMIVRQFG